MPATQMTTAEVPTIYRRLAKAVGPAHWQGAVDRQESVIRSNQFFGDYLRVEYAIAYQLDRLRKLVAAFDTVPSATCKDPSIFTAMVFAAQVLEVLDRSTTKQARTFIKRVRNAFSSAENMHGLRLELQAATHFARRGYHVAWHRVSSQGSFDLLVEDLGPSGLEIECKSISDDKGHRVHRADAIDFWGLLWKDVEGMAQNLNSGLAVVLTVPDRLPQHPAERAALAKAVAARILAGSGASLQGGAELRVQQFDQKDLIAAIDAGQEAVRTAIDKATDTINRNSVVYGTRAGGTLAFVVQSAVADDFLNQVFATLDDSAARQFTGTRGALFWVALQGVDADQLLSLHRDDSASGEHPSALRQGVSAFLHRSPDHVIGVLFGSRSGLLPTIDNGTELAGTSYFFLKEESRFWDPSFGDPLRTIGPTG